MANTQIYVNYGALEGRAQIIDNHNQNLKDTLDKISVTVKNTAGEGTEWESNAAVVVRQKIEAMQPKFENYYNVVKSYADFIRNTGKSYEAGESVNTSNANSQLL